MSAARRCRRVWMAAVLAMGLVLLAGCAAAGAASGGSEQKVETLKVSAPVKEPIFDRDTGDLFARVQDKPQVAKIDTKDEASGKVDTTLSRKFADAGENVAVYKLGAEPGHLYLPQPKLDRISILDSKSLRKTGSYPASSPSQVSVDVGSGTLFALSKDGSTVTAVDLEKNHVFARPKVDRGTEASIEGPERGLHPHFWLAGPEGIAYYEGQPFPIEKQDGIPVRAGRFAIDEVKDTRIYAAEKVANRLVGVETNPANSEKLAAVTIKKFKEPVEYVGVDENRIYAATADELVVLTANNFQSLSSGNFRVLETIDFRRPLKQALKKAPLSGIAVSSATSRVYLTLKGEPYILSIAKPDAP